MDTTAEGVETHDDLALIRELGCSQVQGYIFGRPMDNAAAAALLSAAPTVAAEGYDTNRPPRYSLLRRAELQWNGMTFPVRVRNISIGGALLETDRGLSPGSAVQLDLPGCGFLGAEVRWVGTSKIGIRFEKPFNLAKLSTQGEKVSVRKTVRPAYLDSESEEDSPWAGRTDRLTPDQLRRGTR